MKPRLFRSLFLLALMLGASCVQAFIYENAWEFQATGDFDGNGLADLIIVDKATGDYRIGYQQSPGVYTWVSARASGIANATGLGIGKLHTLSFDSIALTGPDANRINLLLATNTAVSGEPLSIFINSLGPNLAAVIDIGGPTNTPLDDLYVASIYNGVPAFRETLLRNNGTNNLAILADNSIPYLRERANPVLLNTNRPAKLALFERMVGTNDDYLSLFDLSTGAAVSLGSVATLRTPNPFEYVTGQFVTTNPDVEFLVYPPVGDSFLEYQIIEPTPVTYALVYTNQFTLTNFIQQMLALPGTNDTKLLVLDTNGVTETIYTFDGQHQPVAVQQISANPGEHFTGAGVLGNNGFTAYSAPLGQNTSASCSQWNWNGAGYTKVASGQLPRMSAYTAAGNVMQFEFEPFVNSNPILLRINNAGDWSDSPAFSGSPGNISVITESLFEKWLCFGCAVERQPGEAGRASILEHICKREATKPDWRSTSRRGKCTFQTGSETFLSSTQGLANPNLTTLGVAQPLAAFGLANQYSNMLSLFSFTPPAGDKISDVTISPNPGLYSTSVNLQFTAVNPSDSIFFRVGAGAWTTWTPGLMVWLFTNATVQYYGQPLGGSAKSAVKSAVYAFTKPPSTLDSKGDGIPDYVKIAR